MRVRNLKVQIGQGNKWEPHRENSNENLFSETEDKWQKKLCYVIDIPDMKIEIIWEAQDAFLEHLKIFRSW